MISMYTPTIALPDDQFGGAVGADTRSAVLGIPHAAAVACAFAFAPTGEEIPSAIRSSGRVHLQQPPPV